MRLLHVSDTHFGTERIEVVEALQRLACELSPDLLVLSGDITQRARAEQFDAADRFVEQLGIARRLVIPGNHDIPLFDLWTRFVDPYRRFRRVFGDELEPRIETEALRLVSVRTTRRRRHKHGQVDAEQIERVAAAMRDASPLQLRVVVVHQPMHVPRPQDEENLLRNAAAAARAWSQAGVDLVLGGHIHLPYVLPMSQRYSGLGRELWCVQAGTAVSSRVRWEAPNSVNVIDYDRGTESCRVARWDFASTEARFAIAEEHAILLQR